MYSQRKLKGDLECSLMFLQPQQTVSFPQPHFSATVNLFSCTTGPLPESLDLFGDAYGSQHSIRCMCTVLRLFIASLQQGACVFRRTTSLNGAAPAPDLRSRSAGMHIRLAPSKCVPALGKPVCRAPRLSATSCAADTQEMDIAELSILRRHKCTCWVWPAHA